MDSAELVITADLAKIALGEGDLERLGREVTQMLEYFESMKQFDVSGLEPTTHALIQGNRVRPDSVNSNPNLANALVDQAPDLEGTLIVIPNVL